MRSERRPVGGVSAFVARPAQVTVLATAHRCPDECAACEGVAVVAAFGCSDHPLAGGGQDQVADLAAHESGVSPWGRLRPGRVRGSAGLLTTVRDQPGRGVPREHIVSTI